MDEFTNQVVAAEDRVRRSLIGRVPDEAMRDDLVQEAMERAIRKRHQFQEGTNLVGWLVTIARNLHLTLMRKRRREVIMDPVDATAASDARVSIDGAEGGDRDTLACIAALSPNQRDALVAVGYLGMGYEEAGRRLGAPDGTVKSRVSRGRDELAALIQGGIEVDEELMGRLGAIRARTPRSSPFYPIAVGYEELFGRFQAPGSDEDPAWLRLVASGALDHEVEDEI